VHQSRISNAPSWSCDSDWIFSGWVSLFGTSSYSLQAEFGISLFAHARGLGISKPATALVIKWLLDDKSKGGLMFRKFVYCANSENKSSQALAKSVGVKEEGVLRCDGIAERVKDGKGMSDVDVDG
jgi:RimJ/RimL family protein N-acetyltransferase